MMIMMMMMMMMTIMMTILETKIGGNHKAGSWAWKGAGLIRDTGISIKDMVSFFSIITII